MKAYQVRRLLKSIAKDLARIEQAMPTGNDVPVKMVIENPIREAERIIKEVAAEYHVTVDLIKSERRDGFIFRARAIFCRRMREKGWSLPRIGRFLNRDHTSILHAVRRAEEEGWS